MRLDWDPPMNDGGVVITNYLIFVNMSQQVVTTDTTTTFTLNSMGHHLIEISAVNHCGLNGGSVLMIISGDTGWYALHHVNYYAPLDHKKCTSVTLFS